MQRHLRKGYGIFNARILAACAAATLTSGAWAVDQTRRQTASTFIDTVFDLTGNNVRIGQLEPTVPVAHNQVTGAWYT
ncbi:MAG: hypothetical protein ACREJC_09535, partial [Tepidisphaeraceae bacterium]